MEVYKLARLSVLLLIGLLPACNQHLQPEKSAHKTGSIAGGWYLVSAEYNGIKRNDDGKPFQFKLFGEKYFSFLMNNNDAWNYASTCTYEIRDNIYTERFEYSTNEKFEGVYAEWKYHLEGDTLQMEGPIKIVNAEGQEIPELAGGYNTMKELRVRAK